MERLDPPESIAFSDVSTYCNFVRITGDILCDQHAPLTVINVKKNGLARRSGIKVGDEIVFINNISTENMTLLDAQLEIQEAGRSLKIIVRG